MAANIKDNVVPNKKRGRPSKAEIAAREANERRGQADIDAKEAAARGDGKLPGANAPKPAPAPATTDTTAPGYGHNRMSEALFLNHVNAMRAQMAVIETAKLVLKNEKGKLKDLRNTARGDGMGLAELDQALEELETERVDLLARQERLDAYREFLGLPRLATADSPKIEETAASRWYHRGNQAGRLAGDRNPPDGCPPENGQDYMKGFDDGQKALRDDVVASMTKKNAAGSAAAAAANEEAPAVPDAGADETPAMLILREGDFALGTALEDCNKKTVLETVLPRWEAAADVVVVIDGKKRQLKDSVDGYEDTGEAEVDLSEVEPAEPEILAAIAEAEPEIVAQVLADHGDETEDEARERDAIADADREEQHAADADREASAEEAEKIAADKAADAAAFE